MSHHGADIDYLLSLDLDEAKIHATLKVDANAPVNLITRDALCAYLHGRDIQPQSVLHEELDQLVSDVASDNSVAHARVVARGAEPKHGERARIELTEAFVEQFERIRRREEAYKKAIEQDSFDNDQGQAIDFYNESGFVTVSENDHIATFHEHTLGEDGISVTGHPISAKSGKAIAFPCDTSCHIDKDGRIIAMLNGLLQYDRDRISVTDTLTITGYVDFSTGNVNFPGKVIVEKGVRDRFRVVSNCEIEIHKLVEAAHLDSQNNIMLLQGMAGRESGTIKTMGNLKSGYLDAVDAQIKGDCTIEREITNCDLVICGSIDAKNASVRGGTIQIARGGVIGTLGSVQGVRTELVIGSYPLIESKIKLIDEMIEKAQTQNAKSGRELGTLKATTGKPNAEQATEIWYMESNIQSLTEKITELENARTRLQKLLREQTKPELTVLGKLFAKTEIWLPGKRAVFTTDLKGEFKIMLDRTGKPIIDYGNRQEPLQNVAKVNSDERIPAPPRQTLDADEMVGEELKKAF